MLGVLDGWLLGFVDSWRDGKDVGRLDGWLDG